MGHLWKRLDDFHHALGQAFPQPEQAEAAWIDSFERTLGRFSFAWVAEQDGEVRAFLLARLKRSSAFLSGVLVGEISDLYVDDSLRAQGVGAQLVELAVKHLHTQGVHSIEVQVLNGNDDGLVFWEKLGFIPELTQLRLK
jgi:GNAT superfamily N-acetyltransferase